MSWIAAASQACLEAALNADIVQEMTAAERYLRLGQLVKQLHDPEVYRQIALCAATALSNATALAAEVIALGGVPPALTRVGPGQLPAPKSFEEHLMEARAELAHYRGRLELAKRFGVLRLQELFRVIVQSKRRHLAHAAALASASLDPRRESTETG
ncbi:MAG: hypothetical protein LAQ30_24925 [Acidobacteriia bacterium]|nr:hypothetical protein [Terriglobia bacterium]